MNTAILAILFFLFRYLSNAQLWQGFIFNERLFQEDDDTIRLMRSEGCSWIAIGKRIKVHPGDVRARAAAIGIDLTNLFKNGGFSSRRREWTQEQDDIILKGCLLNKTWQAIANDLEISRNTVIERGRRLQAREKAAVAHGPVLPVIETKEIDPANTERLEALPAGHRLTWGLLSSEPYPEKVFPWQATEPSTSGNFRRSISKIKPFNKLHLCFA